MTKLFRDAYPSVVPYISGYTYDDLSRVRRTSHRELVTVCPRGHRQESTFQKVARSMDRGRKFCKQCSRRSLFDELPLLLPFYAGDDAAGVQPRSTVPVRWKDDKGAWMESPNSLWRRRAGLTARSIRPPSLGASFPELAGWLVRAADAELPPMSHRVVEWQCPSGHRFHREVYRFVRSRQCQVCSGHEVGPNAENSVAARLPEMVKVWSARNDVRPEDVHAASDTPVWVDNGDGSQSRMTPSEGMRTFRHRSPCEGDVAAFVVSLVPDELVIRNDRAAVGPKELDVYVPSRNVALEVNGGWWHSEDAGKGREYHRDKVLACREAGILLVQVWEDDWRAHNLAVRAMICAKLGATDSPTIGARQTAHTEVDSGEARAFLEQHHIQGAARGTFYDGLRTRAGELVAVLVTTRTGSVYRIDRYATSKRIAGGFGKLLKALSSRVAGEGGGDIVTFSDNELSNGELYATTGFRLDKELAPDYSYLVGGVRTHKFNYRLARFRTDPHLKYREGASESELAKLNGIPRIWDSGKRRWVLTVPPSTEGDTTNGH